MFVHIYDYEPSKSWLDFGATSDHAIARNCEFNPYNAPGSLNDLVLVKDNIESDKFLRTYLKLCNPNKNFCSHILLMSNEEQSFILTDSVMNIDPSPQDLVKITLNAVNFCRDYFHSEDIDYMVYVNLLTNSGHFSLNNATSVKMELVKKALENDSRLYITQYQLDTCLYEEARKAKLVGNARKLRPEIIVVPNLDTGNAIYKALMKTYNCYGFVVGGTRPAVLNSRSDLDKNKECVKILREYKVIE